MSFSYKQLIHPITNKIDTNTILRKEDNTYIPCDEANTDYQEYLEWKAIDGNEPEAAD